MNAVNSLQPPATPGVEPRPYEPSMEEILASIRRIIADDQSLPGRGIAREPEPEAVIREAPAPEAMSRDGPVEPPSPSEPVPAPVHVLHPEGLHPEGLRAALPASSGETPPPAQEGVEPLPDWSDPAPFGTRTAHGPIAAPQFPTPRGPGASTAPFEPEGGALKTPFHGSIDGEPAPTGLRMEGVPEIERDEPFGQDHGEQNHSEEDHGEHDPVDEERHRNIAAAPDALFSAATDHSVTAAFNTLAATRLADNSDELLGIARDMIRPLLKAWIDDNLPTMVERMVRAEIERVARGGR